MESAGLDSKGPDDHSWLVLVCDDEPSIRRLIRLNLELEGHRVEEVSDGVLALARLLDADRERPDLLLLDGHMEPLDGWGVMSSVRREESLQGLPVVLVSAALHAVDAHQLELAGFAAVLAKPFDPDDLLEVVSCTVARTRGLRSDPRIGG